VNPKRCIQFFNRCLRDTDSGKERLVAIIQDILARKGSQVQTIGPEASVFDAATLMNQHKIGSLLVAEDERLVGIITERDILLRVVAQRRDVDATHVADVMTTEVACARPHTTIEEARSVMKNRRIRHLPVCEEDGHIDGLISIGDLNAWDNDSQEFTIHFMEQYIYGQT
jgi:CBS domain-containing protein